MNRLQFLVELKNSLLTTTKEIAVPIFSEELEKVDKVRDQLAGITWTKLEGISPTAFKGAQEKFINNCSILIFSTGEKLKAFEKKCGSCQSIPQWIAFEKKMKCFSCDKTYEVENEIGDLTCKQYYIKEKDGDWFIGG